MSYLAGDLEGFLTAINTTAGGIYSECLFISLPLSLTTTYWSWFIDAMVAIYKYKHNQFIVHDGLGVCFCLQELHDNITYASLTWWISWIRSIVNVTKESLVRQLTVQTPIYHFMWYNNNNTLLHYTLIHSIWHPTYLL